MKYFVITIKAINCNKETSWPVVIQVGKNKLVEHVADGYLSYICDGQNYDADLDHFDDGDGVWTSWVNAREITGEQYLILNEFI